MKNHGSPQKRACYIVFFLLFLSGTCAAQNADIRWLREINVHRNTSLDGMMKGITNFDYPVTVAIPAAELITGYATHDKKTIMNGWQTVAALGLNSVITYGLKYAVHRPRPYITYPDIQAYETFADHSFPSGHASTAFCTAASVSLCYPKWYVIAPSFLWASAVGYSRMHLGVHYPSDVLAGAIVGMGSAWVAYKVNKWLNPKPLKVTTEGK
jgi:membrane-associated phospholipid phosphatase